MIKLHHTNPALKNNEVGAKFQEFDFIDEKTGLVYGYKRSSGNSEVIVLINLGQESSQFFIDGFKLDKSQYKSIASADFNIIETNLDGNEIMPITPSALLNGQMDDQIELPPFSFLILHK